MCALWLLVERWPRGVQTSQPVFSSDWELVMMYRKERDDGEIVSYLPARMGTDADESTTGGQTWLVCHSQTQ